MKKIAVITSGGDAPGMNACIRAVVRTGIFHNLEVIGVRRGYEGLIDGDFLPMDSHSVSNIIQRGGTILKTSRSSRFMTGEGINKAIEMAKNAGIEGFIMIGGDGTFKGANEFSRLSGIPCMGAPGTIDNDLYGTDFTIGYDTALNTVINAVDKIRDTAASHSRLFFVEVMGRDAGFIALNGGVGAGAEEILIPETSTDISELIKHLEEGWKRHKSSVIIIVAEGDKEGGAFEVARKVKEKFNHYDTRVTVIGHMQRGGSPTCFDRVLASRLGAAATEALIQGKKNLVAGLVHNQVVFTPIDKARKHKVDVNEDLIRISRMLST
ncbi:MAG: 6-phosphofructokinase [Bacteroidia bacterium]|nr:6-phosphofructokinase [Bacteroidia bacterium]